MQAYNLTAEEIETSRQRIARSLSYKALLTTLTGALISIPACRHANGNDICNLFSCAAILVCLGVNAYRSETTKFEAARLNINFDALSSSDQKSLPAPTPRSSWKEAGQTFITLRESVENEIPWLDGANILCGFVGGTAAQWGLQDFHHFVAQGREAVPLTLHAVRTIGCLVVSWVPCVISTLASRKINRDIERFAKPTLT